MKRITFFIATLCLLLVNVNAQTIENIAQLNSDLYTFIPKDFSADGNAVPMLRLEENKIVILNEDFSLGREIAYVGTFYYYVEFLNLDECSYYENSIPFTQTLFNNDDKVEFIGVIGELDQWGDIINIEGYKIVNEDNEVLFTIEETSNDIRVLRWKGMYYLIFPYYNYDYSDLEVINVYAINKDGNESSISKVKTMSGLKAFPALANRNSVVDVTIDEASATEGGELVIVDNGGRVVAKQPFEPGQTTVPVRTSRMRTGVYNITLNNGAKVENARIIVK